MSDNPAQTSIYEDTKEIPGWLLPDETLKLFELAHSHGDVILEVGTFRGRSAVVLNTGASRHPERIDHQFYSIDIDPSSAVHAYNVLKPCGLEKRALFFHGNLKDFRDRFPITPTMAFIDGDHTYGGVRSDLEELRTLLAPNTPVAFHDYLNADTTGVARAIDEWIQAGYAVRTGVYGCTAFLTTTTKCSGQPQNISERKFRQHYRQHLRRIRKLSNREKIATIFPWLVPIVRRVKRIFRETSSPL